MLSFTKLKKVRNKNVAFESSNSEIEKGIIMKKNGLFAKGMALFLALLMIGSVVFALLMYVLN